MRIGPDWRLIVVGSPSYCSGRAVPKTPHDLTGHRCINLRLTTYGGLYAWEFEKDGQTLNVRVDGQLVFNSTVPILKASLAGHGLAFVPEDMAMPHIEKGELVRCSTTGASLSLATTCTTPAAARPRRHSPKWSRR